VNRIALHVKDKEHCENKNKSSRTRTRIRGWCGLQLQVPVTVAQKTSRDDEEGNPLFTVLTQSSSNPGPCPGALFFVSQCSLSFHGAMQYYSTFTSAVFTGVFKHYGEYFFNPKCLSPNRCQLSNEYLNPSTSLSLQTSLWLFDAPASEALVLTTLAILLLAVIFAAFMSGLRRRGKMTYRREKSSRWFWSGHLSVITKLAFSHPDTNIFTLKHHFIKVWLPFTFLFLSSDFGNCNQFRLIKRTARKTGSLFNLTFESSVLQVSFITHHTLSPSPNL